MLRESVVVIASSLYIFCNQFEFRERAGYVLFHIILLVVSSIHSLRWTDGLERFEFRPLSGPGVEIGSLLVPMVLTSQLTAIGCHPSASNSKNLMGDIQSYLLASQLMSMCTVSILLLLNKSRRLLSWVLLFIVTTCMAATVNIQWDGSMSWLFSWLVLYLVFLVFILLVFPKSFTLGEGMIIVQTCLLLALDSWASVGNKLHYIIPSMDRASFVDISRSVYSYWLQILLVGSLLTGFLLLPVFYYITIASNRVEMWIGAISFYVVIFLVFISFLLPWSYLMLGGMNPFGWVIYYAIYNNTRKYLILYWSCVVIFSVGLVAWKNHSSKALESKSVIRKYFHILAIAIFFPGVVYEPNLTHLAASVAVAVFIFLEYVRMSRVAPLGHTLHSALSVFLDEKDAGPVILTHIYLLVGCCLPLWLYPFDCTSNDGKGCSLALYSGILSLGIGDTMASVVGKRFGRHRWQGSLKTVEGTTAGIVAQMLCVFALAQAGFVSLSRSSWIPVLTAVIGSSFLEAWTSQIDNIVLPPFLFSALLASCR